MRTTEATAATRQVYYAVVSRRRGKDKPAGTPYAPDEIADAQEFFLKLCQKRQHDPDIVEVALLSFVWNGQGPEPWACGVCAGSGVPMTKEARTGKRNPI
jgi:hypothetical protein